VKDAGARWIDPFARVQRLVRLLACATAAAVALPDVVVAQSLTFTGTVDDVRLPFGDPAVVAGEPMRAWLTFVDDPVLVDVVDYDGLGNPGQSGELAVYRRNGIAALSLASTNLRVHVSHVNIFNDCTDAMHPDPIDAWNCVVEIGTACDPGVVEVASFSLIDPTGTSLSDTGFVEASSVDGLDGSFTFAGGMLDPARSARADGDISRAWHARQRLRAAARAG